MAARVVSEPTPLAARLAGIHERLGIDPDAAPPPAVDVPREQADAEARRRVAWERWDRAIPRRFRGARLDHLPAPLAEQLAAWAKLDERPNLVLTGPVGTGKTYAACAAVRPLVGAGATLAFWPVVRLLDQLRPGHDPDPYDEAAGADLLVLDDLGAERATEWTAERLYALVNDRWLDERPTLATTNLPPPALATAIGERLASRLLGGATIARLAGPDQRMSNP